MRRPDLIRPWAMAEFRAMGNRCRIVAPDHDLAIAGQQLVESLDARWSRFRPTSEVCALNTHAGQVTLVSPQTYRLLQHAEQARVATAGWFNPLQLDRLEQLGYARTWDDCDHDSADAPPDGEPACAAPIEFFPGVNAVRLPAHTRFDPGGIGKGLAGDMVAEHLIGLGAESVQIELGGDVRVAGAPWQGEAWEIVLEGVDGEPHCARMALGGGGVATSGTHRRSWRCGGRNVHHLLDPHSGWPADTDLTAATVTAESLWFAEAMAKSVVMAGAWAGAQLLADRGLAGALHHSRGDAASIEFVGQTLVSSRESS